MLFSVALAERHGTEGLTAFSLHPGSIWTNLGRHLDEEGISGLRALDKKQGNYEGDAEGFKFKSISQGTSTYVFSAFDQSIAAQNGAYLLDVRLAKPEEIRNNATNKGSAEKLWKLSNEIVGQKF
jgi:NAD(P)-dependent dehydrogenase (short-subunit alcohol dehydrogenase family)